jgi:CheY-like chemotaxis protein
LLIDNNTLNQCARAIVFNGAAASVSNGVTISNNIVGDQGAASPVTPPYASPASTVYTKGIWVAGTASIAVTGNTLKNVLSYVGTTMTAVEIVRPVTNTLINNNSVTNLVNNGTVSITKGILISSTTGTYSIAGNNVSNVQALAGASGTDGVQAARAFHPEVVLCDLGLPGMTGYEVATALRKDPETRSAKLIAVTGYGRDEDRRRSKEAGFDLHLTKPVDPAQLKALLLERKPLAGRS